MIKVTFITADGTVQDVEAVEGQRLLEIAQAAGQPLEGTCEGQMACSTCHVIIDKLWFDNFPSRLRTRKTCSTLLPVRGSPVVCRAKSC